MEALLCGLATVAVIGISFFFICLNTARKNSAPPAGKKEYTPVYVSLADRPDTIMQGMDRFVAEVQKTESAGDKWRWIPLMIFFAGLGSDPDRSRY